MFAILMMVVFTALTIGGLVVALTSKKPQSTDGNYSQYRHEEFPKRGVSLVAAAVGAILLVVTSLFAGLYSQDPGQAKVLRSFTGEVTGTDTTEGLGIKAPWVDTVDYDIRNQVVSYIGDGSAKVRNSKGEEVLVTGPAITTQDKDGASASIDLIVRYSINPTSVESIYKEYGSQDNFESKMVENDVKSVVRNIPLQYSTTDFRLKREEAAAKMRDALATRWEKAGVQVDSVDLQGIRYPENIELSLQAVQEAINNANKAKADLETAKVEAEKTRVEAQAQADYDQIVRCGATTTTVQEVINGTETDVVKVIPLQGDDCQNRLNEQVLTNKYIDALKELGKDGNVIVVPEGSMPMLQIPAAN